MGCESPPPSLLHPGGIETIAGRRQMMVVLVASLGAAYAWIAAGTRPFTTGADLATAAAFAVLTLVMVRSLHRRHRLAVAPQATPPPSGSLLPWVVAFCVFVLWELATYLAGLSAGRHAFPTLSSLSDVAFRWRGAKTACFAAWLALGWGLVRR